MLDSVSKTAEGKSSFLDRKHVKEAFAEYVREYDVHDPKIALKVEHTYKVANICDKIARSEGANGEFVDLAWLAGMLHDIGRFEQITRYGTFSDAKSVSHAALSAQILFDDGLIEKLAPSLNDAYLLDSLKTAIATHTDWQLPEGLSAYTCDLCNVLRDADKVDIMRVNCECPVEVIYPFTAEELNNSELTREVVEAFYERHTVLSKLRMYPADYALSHCAFGWELVFSESRKMALEQGFLARLFEHDWRVPATRETFERAQRDMLDWLTEKSSCDG